MTKTSTLAIELTCNEAAVLFDYLSRELDSHDGRRMLTTIDHDSEVWALNSVLVSLEKTLSAPFKRNYDALVSNARTALLSKFGNWPLDSE